MKRDYGRCYTDRTYLLAAGAYVAADYQKLHLFQNRYLKWGYFPKESTESLDVLLQKKEPMSIIWAGRLISWKRPMQALEVANHLKENHISFHMYIIGNGKLENRIRRYINNKGLNKNVSLLGSLPFAEVRNYMERSQILLFTSNRQEGWGAVLNEAMTSACTVVANKAIGAVPFLLRQRENGIIYDETTKELIYCVDELINNPNSIIEYGKKAWETIHYSWNAVLAAKRILEISNRIIHDEKVNIYQDGPCSQNIITGRVTI